jgi:hypothetical protein
MWVKKTEKEIENDNKVKIGFWTKFNQGKLSPFLMALVISIFFILLFLFIELFIGQPLPRYPYGHGGFGDKIKFSEIPNELHFYFKIGLFIFIIIFICFYPWKKGELNKKLGETYICDKCNSLKKDDGNYFCKCGGVYRDLKEMKWIEDK